MTEPMTERDFVYKIVEVVKVTDGDTYWLRVDVGFRALVLIHVRLFGYDTPEVHRGSDFEKTQAIRAREVAESWLNAYEGVCWIQTQKDPDNFGRWLGTLWVENADELFTLGARLREESLASVWPTRWREEYDQ